MNQLVFVDRLRSILSDNNAPRTAFAQRSGCGIDESRLALAPAGFKNVFRRAIRNQYADYRVALLLDNSGSMYRGGKIEAACESMHAIYAALSLAGIKPLSYLFNCEYEAIPADVIGSREKFGVSYCNNHGNHNGNHDGYAIEQTAAALQATGSAAKVMLVFSDGSPACDHGCSNPGNGNESSLTAAIKRARLAGITCLSIGIKTDAPTRFYGVNSSTIVNELSSLYSAACTLLACNIHRG